MVGHGYFVAWHPRGLLFCYNASIFLFNAGCFDATERDRSSSSLSTWVQAHPPSALSVPFDGEDQRQQTFLSVSLIEKHSTYSQNGCVCKNKLNSRLKSLNVALRRKYRDNEQ